MKFCKDCIFFLPHPTNESCLARCGHPSAQKFNLVDGIATSQFCNQQRIYDFLCGEFAENFQPKESSV